MPVKQATLLPVDETRKARTKGQGKAPAAASRKEGAAHKNGKEHLRARADRGKSRGYLSAEDWEKRGVAVVRLSGDLPPDERETGLSFFDKDKFAEVTTALYSWQKRLESLGCVPTIINTFQDSSAEIRYYARVPRRFIRLPSAGRKKVQDGEL